jgi:hypothetical protein
VKIERAASRPVAAAFATDAIPVTSSENTSGMIVIFRALSQRTPTYSTCSRIRMRPGSSVPPATAPTAMPSTSASTVMRLAHFSIGIPAF